jgi:hypothetical protein
MVAEQAADKIARADGEEMPFQSFQKRIAMPAGCG